MSKNQQFLLGLYLFLSSLLVISVSRFAAGVTEGAWLWLGEWPTKDDKILASKQNNYGSCGSSFRLRLTHAPQLANPIPLNTTSFSSSTHFSLALTDIPPLYSDLFGFSNFPPAPSFPPAIHGTRRRLAPVISLNPPKLVHR
ncbi:hypothetical protein SDJN02_17432, partial [Cucurbita argyrosperma subsp. argyrosperma]